MEKKFWFQVIGLLILIFGGLALTFNQGILTSLGFPQLAPNLSPARRVTPQTQLAILDSNSPEGSLSAKAIFNIEVASTPETRRLGLGGRESLATNSGMLFVFDAPSKPSFWMKGMKFSLDIIWVRENVIVDLLQNVPPPAKGQADAALPLYAPVTEIDKVLEVNAGDIARYKIKLGDRLQLNR